MKIEHTRILKGVVIKGLYHQSIFAPISITKLAAVTE
jgi:hypothetical protein